MYELIILVSYKDCISRPTNM